MVLRGGGNCTGIDYSILRANQVVFFKDVYGVAIHIQRGGLRVDLIVDDITPVADETGVPGTEALSGGWGSIRV